jgi:hypothetical protein
MQEQEGQGNDLPPGWPSPVRKMSILSSADGSAQPAAFYPPEMVEGISPDRFLEEPDATSHHYPRA